ncbi:nitrogenase iron-molybdenum cofactor biosynthesis protein NifE [Clostridium aceticum]|uniref:Nitrogenase iron-molybdenum cofactor biosynthesis protein NifE n=1 Tax=Clostridium aceticum TaxID=84022 RepID=A0A0D8IBW5_9CLOT|nr:nitrogenase iron-molybdenum cofactor biosynthesis protein NifE [Clostridium aceticum]AKL94867.1 nitrogenase iron-molybdenum cofactor biosynthesis protein NifE [Clostridium aceticum]KJF27795.1 nitrogenase iron-molybdenum cofactor biosynthesis protein NifE [Clostridium aceticum]
MGTKRCLGALEERSNSILEKSKNDKQQKISCDQNSVAGAVSQRACVYCGARVVLNPITDAYHIVHGPIGCASYTFDIRGSLSSGEEVYRNSFSTDLRERDIIFGGERKLTAAIDEIVEQNDPKLIFIYSTCVVGVIGDDLEGVARAAEKKYKIPVIPIQSSGFAGNKNAGYKAACHALLNLMGEEVQKKEEGINFLGDFNLAGEMWINQSYFERMGISLISKMTGDASYKELKKAPRAKLNIVQCAGSMTYLAKQMEERYDIPFINVSFYGLEDTVTSLRKIASTLKDQQVLLKTEALIESELKKTHEALEYYRKKLEGKKAAIYVGGGFKAISLIKQFRDLGMETVMVGTQTGRAEEYEVIRDLAQEGTVILDDSNPTELEKFMKEKGADILVGGVKERPLAYKLGVAFCDHNHERKHPLNGFEGAINFAQEIHASINSPVWKIIKREQGGCK